MVEVLSQDEDAPASYPAAPSDLSTAAAAIEPAVIWQRIEDWIAYRWKERTVTWVIEGPGVFAPTLKPASIDTREVWNGEAWETVTLDPAPTGELLDPKTYRITATVGTTDTPPETLREAYRRLAEYLVDQSHIGRVATSGTRSVDGVFSVSSERPTAWQAKALHHSGAADLLRHWRR